MLLKQALTDPESFWGTVTSRATGAIQNLRKKRALNSLEGELAQILRTANAHKTKGKKPGHAVYQELAARADSKINTFCQQWNVSRTSVDTQVPALRDLFALTVAAANPPLALKAILVWFGAIFACIAVGFIAALVSVGFHGTIQLVHRLIPFLR